MIACLWGIDKQRDSTTSTLGAADEWMWVEDDIKINVTGVVVDSDD